MSQNIFNLFQKFLSLIDRVIYSIIGFALLAFLWGIVKFVFFGSSNDKLRTEGRSYMLYGILTLFVMTSLWGIIHLMQSLLGPSYIGDVEYSPDAPVSPEQQFAPVQDIEDIFDNNLPQEMI